MYQNTQNKNLVVRMLPAVFMVLGLTTAAASAASYCAVETSADACLYASPPSNCKLVQTQNDECIYVHFKSQNGRRDSTTYEATCSYDVYTTDSLGNCVFDHKWTGESQCERASGRNCIASGTGG